MKKKSLTGFPERKCLKKTWRIMRLTIFLLFGFILTVSANSYSQTTRMDISLRNSTINDVIEYVEENSEFVFLYRKEDLNVFRRFNINLKNASIDQILEQALKNEQVTYDVYERQIVIRKAIQYQSMGNQEQNKKISGIVTDKNGSPLPGVTVVVKGTTRGTITDADGNYSLTDVSSDATLVFSFVGMKTQELPIEGQTSINVILAEETIGLEEVVAIGYGTQKKVTLTGSVSTVDTEVLKSSPVGNITRSLGRDKFQVLRFPLPIHLGMTQKSGSGD